MAASEDENGTVHDVVLHDDVDVSDEVAEALETSPWLACPQCNAPLPFTSRVSESCLLGTLPPCPSCHQTFNWWRAIVRAIRDHFPFGQFLTMAGARAFLCRATAVAGETVEVDLRKHGLPDDAEIVHMNLTPRGSVFPVLVHGNTAVGAPIGPRFAIYGRPSRDAAEPSCSVDVMVTWFAHAADDTVVRHLVDAARRYQLEHFEGVIIPANIAAEAALGESLAAFFSSYGSRDHVRNLLSDGATYSHQLNVLINVAADTLGIPRLDADICGVLNRLRKLRNQLAHGGTCPRQDRGAAAEHLAAAILVVSYSAIAKGRVQAIAP